MALDAEPMKTLEEATVHTDIVETVNDAEIAAKADAARRLGTMSENLSHRAGDHAAAQVAHETMAVTSAAGAENALTESAFHAQETEAVSSDIAANRHHILGSSAEARAQDAGAKAGALEGISRVEIAVQEETHRIEMGQRQVEDRTAAGVKEEMKALGAIEDTAKMTEDLEAELAANADPSIAAPRA